MRIQQRNHHAIHGIHSLVSRIYTGRGLQSPAEWDYTHGTLESGAKLRGIKKAAVRIAQAALSGEKIIVVGDFDCDGATATALCMNALSAMGACVDFMVPNRFSDGYGLTPPVVDRCLALGASLIITVDNGISSIDGVSHANTHGIDVVITDHHLAGEQVPDAHAIVNPNQKGCSFPSKALAGVGVAWYVMQAVTTLVNHAVPGRTPLNLMSSLLDLVAVGTVADVVPLDRNNRMFVSKGLSRIKMGQGRPGIQALISVSGKLIHQLTASDVGFAIGPRLNAAGRMDDMRHGIQLLLETDDSAALSGAQALHVLNEERKRVERAMQMEAQADLANLTLDSLPPAIVVYQPQWHQGVIGIVASRLKDEHYRPVVCFADDTDNDNGEPLLKGSCRSIAGIHIRDCLGVIDSDHPGMIKKFGGHAMAAGLTIARDQLMAFTDALHNAVMAQAQAETFEPVVWTDGNLLGHEMVLSTAEMLREMGPFGQAFPEPLFDNEFTVIDQRIVGGQHVKMVLEADDGTYIDGIHFYADMDTWPNMAIQRVRALYKLDVNEFRGERNPQLLIDELMPIK